MSTAARRMYMEDVDEDTGSAVEGTRTFSASVAPSPTKEKPNTSRTRKESARRASSSSPHAHGYTDSDSTALPPPSPRKEKESSRSRKEKELRQQRKEKEQQHRDAERRAKDRERERERERLAAMKKVSINTISARPLPKHSKTTPPVLHTQSTAYRRPTNIGEDSPLNYGVSPGTTPASGRPRASTHRPKSYYGPNSRPPAANSQWYANQAYTPTSYPPQTWATAGGVPYAMPAAAPVQSHPVDYFGASPYPPLQPQPQHHLLAQRFQQRPSSAMGHRSNSYNSYASDDYDQDSEPSVSRRASQSRKNEEARRRMPPPPRPVSAAPMRQAIRPPPQPMRSVGYDDEDLAAADPSLYQEIIPRAYTYDVPALQSQHPLRPRPRRGSVTYDMPTYSVQPATTTTGRRHSYMGVSGNSYEDKARQAFAYQEAVSGGPQLPLTSETLLKVSKRHGGGSSRSTRSSESRDESSDYRKSNTTRTTRSSSDEDITIKVTGTATLKVGGAEIQCQDGGEINIARPGGGRFGGSDKASTIFFDDRRSRAERLPTRTRATSQAGSWTRTGFDSYVRPTGFI